MMDSSELAQLFSQVLSGAVDPCFDGADAGHKGLGDFLIAETLLLKKEDGLALLLGQGAQGLVEGFSYFPA